MAEDSPVVSATEAKPLPAEPADGAGGAAGVVAALFLAVIVTAALVGLVRSVMRNRSS